MLRRADATDKLPIGLDKIALDNVVIEIVNRLGLILDVAASR